MKANLLRHIHHPTSRQLRKRSGALVFLIQLLVSVQLIFVFGCKSREFNRGGIESQNSRSSVSSGVYKSPRFLHSAGELLAGKTYTFCIVVANDLSPNQTDKRNSALVATQTAVNLWQLLLQNEWKIDAKSQLLTSQEPRSSQAVSSTVEMRNRTVPIVFTKPATTDAGLKRDLFALLKTVLTRETPALSSDLITPAQLQLFYDNNLKDPARFLKGEDFVFLNLTHPIFQTTDTHELLSALTIVLFHEMGHFLGLADLYETDEDYSNLPGQSLNSSMGRSSAITLQVTDFAEERAGLYTIK